MPQVSCKKLWSVILSFLFATSLTQAQAPPSLSGAAAATVRIPTHGISATVIYTEQGRSFLLGCAHGYEGSARTKKMAFDIPIDASRPPVKGPAHSTLIAVDYQRDLSLVEIDKGPFPYVAYVAPLNWLPGGHRLIAAGYDDMVFPPHQDPAHIVGDVFREGHKVWLTREKPWHGRSGGGLIDIDSGLIVGVCEGYENVPGGRGYYVDLSTIHEFLNVNWPTLARPPPPQQVITVPQESPKVITDIQIPREIRVYNKSGNQCWACALETAARYLKIERLYDLTDKYKGAGDYGPTERILNSRRVRHKSTQPGCKDKTIFVESIHMGFPVAFGRGGTHMMLLTGIDDKKVRILANSTDTEIHEEDLKYFLDEWDGWAVVLYPDVKDTTPQQSPIKKSPSSPLEYQYQDIGPVIRYPQQQSPQPIYQQPYYVPRQQQPFCPGGS